MSLAGRRALVTGSTSGIGLAIARALHADGAEIILNGFGDSAEIDALCGELGALYSPANLLDVAEIEAMMARFGPVDILVNNAGMQFVSPVEDFPVDKWNAIIGLNLTAAFHTTRLAVPAMKDKGWGRIINVSSVAGKLASALGSPYCMTKHAVEAFTASLRAEMEPFGIDVTKVNPGPYDTGFNDRMVNGIATWIPEGDAATAAAHEFISGVVLTDQLDPGEVATALADLVEAETTPPETLLPEGIGELLQAMIETA